MHAVTVTVVDAAAAGCNERKRSLIPRPKSRHAVNVGTAKEGCEHTPDPYSPAPHERNPEVQSQNLSSTLELLGISLAITRRIPSWRSPREHGQKMVEWIEERERYM